MKKFIRVADHVTAQSFGCDQEHFDKHIKGKVLDVTSAMTHTLFVKDSEGETWTIFREDTINVDVAGKPLKELTHG